MSIGEKSLLELETKNILSATAPIRGHYSHATELPNGVIYLSGQKAWRGDTPGPITGDIADQTNVVFDHLESILNGLGLSLRDTTRFLCYLNSEQNYSMFNAVYERRLKEHKPARAVLTGLRLRDSALVEIVAEAFRSK